MEPQILLIASTVVTIVGTFDFSSAIFNYITVAIGAAGHAIGSHSAEPNATALRDGNSRSVLQRKVDEYLPSDPRLHDSLKAEIVSFGSKLILLTLSAFSHSCFYNLLLLASSNFQFSPSTEESFAAGSLTSQAGQ